MITSGVDIGAENIRAVVMDGDKILGRALRRTGDDQKDDVIQAMKVAIKEPGLEERGEFSEIVE